MSIVTPFPMARSAPRPLLFLDFEASSLTPASWPVEIGFAWIDRGRVETRALLIAPRADWSMEDWSDTAGQVHGITLDAILSAPPAETVAAETDAFAQYDVVSDNPVWEQRWLNRLRTGRPRVEVRPFRAAIRDRLDEAEANAVARSLLRSRAPHRAGPDAARLAQAWLDATPNYGLAA